MATHNVSIIGAPMDLGAGRRGVDMGPSALRLAGLDERVMSLGYDVQDLGNIAVEQPESLPVGPQRARYLAEITKTCVRLGTMVGKVLEDKRMPIVLGGDHSVAVGTVAGLSNHFRQ